MNFFSITIHHLNCKTPVKDYHIHTNFSDGENSIEEMVEAAVKFGYTEIAITDHVWKTSDWFPEYCDRIDALKNKYHNIRILKGFEAKALNVLGTIDAGDYIIKRSEVKLGAIHRIPLSEREGEFINEEKIKSERRFVLESWQETTINLIKNEHVDIIAHPFAMMSRYDIEIDFKFILELFKKASEYEKKLEISGRYLSSNIHILNALERYPAFANYVSYGSDSHSIRDLNWLEKRAEN
jgi:putative hydrolase